MIVSFREEMLPSPLDENDWIIKGPDVINELQLHVEYLKVVGL
jgi:hypothetical protein